MEFYKMLKDIKDSVRTSANEVQGQLTGNERELVYEILEQIEDLVASLEEFEEVLDVAWERTSGF